MKISALPKLTSIRRDIEFPLAVQGENRSITLGQIIDAVSQDVIPFDMIRGFDPNVQYSDGSPGANIGSVVFDTVTNRFYLARTTTVDVAGIPTTKWTYFQTWGTYGIYYEDDEIRTDCLFRLTDGRLYFFDGATLKSAGITEEQAKQIRHSTPIEVASEEEMAQRIEAGEYEEGQLYFLAESE